MDNQNKQDPNLTSANAVEPQPTAVNVVPTQPQSAVVSGTFVQPSSANIQTPKKKSWTWLIISLAIVAVVVVAGLISSLVVIPNKNTKEFTAKSQVILQDLSKTITDVHDNNFMDATKTTDNFDQAKALLKVHMADYSASNDKINSLKSEYTELKPTKRNAELKKKVDDAFASAEKFMSGFKSTLEFRENVFTAYGQLPSQLDTYKEMISKDGLRSSFVSQTQTIADSADTTIKKITIITVPEDEKETYNLRLQSLQDIKDSFTTLSQYYSTVQDSKIGPLLTAFSARNIKINDKLKTATQKYVTESSVALEYVNFQKLSR